MSEEGLGAAEAPAGIAIIGMSGRFPGAPDVDAFWRNLRAGVESITRLTDARLEASGTRESLRRDPRYVPARGLLEDVDLFDANFFRYSPREAELIDPQQRLFLETAWEALENAGYDSERFAGPIGLFAGAGQPGYLLHQVAPHLEVRELLESLGAVLGNDKDHLTTRTAYKLNLRGPVVTVQTACSTSLVAVHLACQALLDFQCDMALAGGVSIAFPRDTGYLFQEGHILSSDGHCRPFDAKAQGTVPGDGVGVVVLKRLEDALAAGDTIRAVILGSAINNDGSAKVGYTAPSIDGQAEVIQLAHALADVGARSISYIETHGTATALGDAIEMAALTQAFRRTTQDRNFCAIGSVKSNFGHLNTAAGVASLIKTVLALENQVIPPSLHFQSPHPKLGLESSPFFVNDTAREWRPGATRRRAGVSAFSMGGTNAHLILEEAPRREAGSPAGPGQLLVLSAPTDSALKAMVARLQAHLGAHPELELADVAYTLQLGRREFAHRCAVVCRDTAEATRKLQELHRLHMGVASTTETGVAFLFPGQGSQRLGMARALYRAEAVFREEVDRCARLLQPRLGLDLREVLIAEQRTGELEARLEQTALAQPALFTLEHALACLWRSRGVKPVAMLGHSLGEYVAACLAEVLSLEDALALVAARGRLMQGLPAGAMVAVPLAEAELLTLLPPGVSLAAINGPEACVASGPLEAVEALEHRLSKRGVLSRRLQVSHAFHSEMMAPILDAFAEEVRRVSLKPPRLAFLSGVTGTWATGAQVTQPDYWVQHLRLPVRFFDALSVLSQERHLLLEVGPGSTLSALARQQGAASPRVFTSLPPSPEEEDSRQTGWLETLGQLWVAGVPVSWKPPPSGVRRYRVPLPTYPFERQRYWVGHRQQPVSIESIEESLRQKLDIRPVEAHPGLEKDLKKFCSSLLHEYLRASGIDVREGAVHTRQELRRRLGIQRRFDRLFEFSLESLVEDGLLERRGEELRFSRQSHELEGPRVIRQRLDAAHPEFRGLFDFVEHCVSRYDQALSGKVEAISVLYPDGSARFLQQCKAQTAEHTQERIYLQLLQEVVYRLSSSARGRRLRILELGGGQGLLTWPLVSALKDFDIEYHFTDLGKVFVDDARQEAAGRGLSTIMEFGVLDISRDPREQGYGEGTFDLLVAYNVVHATADVKQTLRYLERLLRPGGLLGLVEAVRIRRWEMLSWGLAEGWWFYDDGLRQGSPLLSLSTWERVLVDLGFEGVESFPREEEVRAHVDHGLVLARRASIASSPRVVPAARPVQAAPPAPLKAGYPRPPLEVEYVAPRSELERRITSLCEELLGVAPVGIRDDFVSLGGDSLIILRLTDRLQKELRRELPAGMAFRGLTVEQLARALERVPEPQGSTPLVPIHTGGSKPPLFLVHPAAGVVFPYFELARQLGPDQPLYGLQALGLDGESQPDERVEDMARHYVEALRTVQPQGPYFIGGHSFGSLVAFEMAQQLTAAGQEIGMLAIIDEPAPLDGYRPSFVEMTRFLSTGVMRSIWPHLHDYFYLRNASRKQRGERSPRVLASPLQRMEKFLARAALANFVPPDSRVLALRQAAMLPMFQIFLLHMRETITYQPSAYPHKVTLFSSDEVRRSRGRREPKMGWDKLAAGGVEVHEVPGDHLSLLKSPHVQTLARKLEACLTRALDATRSRGPQRIAL